jgi:hypothetical protein
MLATTATALVREQAHIDRRAPVTVQPQVLKADMKGKRRPNVAPVREVAL